MLHASFHAESVDSIASFFRDAQLSRALAEASAVLVQLFWRNIGRGDLDAAVSSVMAIAPGAVVIGCSSAGTIGKGSISDRGMVLSVSCFKDAALTPLFLEAEPEREEDQGRRLAASLAGIADLRAVLLLAPPLSIDAAAIVRGLKGLSPSIAIFGAGATKDDGQNSGILLGGKIKPKGVAAVGLSGASLHIEMRTIRGWRPLGPGVTLTQAEPGCIHCIDGKPAFEHYGKTLGIEDGEDLNLVEFPLLFERDGELIARNPMSLEADGGIRMIADAVEGESARLGYLDMALAQAELRETLGHLREFSPQAIYLYSCVCRRFALQEAIEMETRPFEGIAPTAGVFTAGEFCSLGGRLRLHNFSEVAVALREGPPSSGSGGRYRDLPGQPSNASAERHTRLTGHLLNFISTLREDLGAEVVERRKAENEARAIAEEKGRLLKELQHRVKNSLVLISSMASIEAQKAGTPEARDALRRLETRIAALASLYDLLYTTGSIEEIPLPDYLGRVVDFAATGLGADAKGISIESRIEAVTIDVKRAIPIGLIVNELVTDSIKHAFAAGRKGRIEVALIKQGGELLLGVRDDGVGLPADFSIDKAQGFGLILVKSLAAQLDASFSARTDGGAAFELRMPL